MEVIPSSGVQHAGESDCIQHNSKVDFICDGESNGFDHEKEVASVYEGDLNCGQSEGLERTDELAISEGRPCGALISDYQIESQRLSDDSHLIVGTVESELGTSRDAEPFFQEPEWLRKDEPLAVWVKWRGKWQAGIRCARADWPLSTLRAKPTHDRKKYFVIYFPNTKNYSWADMLLVRSIYELPEPIAHRTHKIGIKLVQDLGVARRFIMKKLAVGVLSIIDQFHSEALVETARDMMLWKDFASEVSHCSDYSDLGRMLLKLQNTLLQHYITSDWLQHSVQSWVQQCQVAHSAEAVELLKEEFFDSVLWNKINSLPDAPLQQSLGSEWKTWKHEVMKSFMRAHHMPSGGELEQQIFDSPVTMSLQVSRKRPKLEIRRADTNASHVEVSSPLPTMTVEFESVFFDNQGCTNAGTLSSASPNLEDVKNGTTALESLGSVANRWDDIVVEPTTSRFANSKVVATTSDFVGSSPAAEVTASVDTPMCGGITVLGTRCKHRSLPGFIFCKKHRPQTDAVVDLSPPENTLKRKHAEIPGHMTDIVLAGEDESPMDVDPLAIIHDEAVHGQNSFGGKLWFSVHDNNSARVLHCVGSNPQDGAFHCHESPKHYSLYCDQHLPNWVKRARNGKSRIITKEVFIGLLKACSSQGEKLQLHHTCELFYKFFKTILSIRNPISVEAQLEWALSEASKDFQVGELLLKLVCAEKERLIRLWGLNVNNDSHVSSSDNKELAIVPFSSRDINNDEKSIRCRFCLQELPDDQELTNHVFENHKKEALWIFRGYACAICLDSCTNMNHLESHVQERHHVQFVEQCMLLQCISCKSHFGNADELWSHVVSVHPVEFRLSKDAQMQNPSMHKEKEDSLQKLQVAGVVSRENDPENSGDVRRFVCRFCGLKFDLLPDLGRHHQAAHMGEMFSSRPKTKGIRYYAHRMKSGRLSRPKFKKGLGMAAYRIRNRNGNLKQIQLAKPISSLGWSVHPQPSEAETLGRLPESHCSTVAKILFSKIQKTKQQLNSLDILAVARSTCCKVSLKASLERKYGLLPERLYLKAAKLCSEHNVQVEWHRKGFLCPRGCKSFKDPELSLPSAPRPHNSSRELLALPSVHSKPEWEVDECHFVINIDDLRGGPKQNVTVMCKDISFGKEMASVACVVYDDLLESFGFFPDKSDGQITESLRPWENFTYITEPMVNQQLCPNIESLQLGCDCRLTMCSPETCNHVYLFDNDYEDARDIHGKSMRGRFPYDNKGRIVLEEGYMVYECNRMCCCNKTCQNRVLQNGIKVKLEVFKTEKKGWGVRVGEPILLGTFICEIIGEVIDEQEADKRRERYGIEGSAYLYDVDAQANDMSRLIEGHDQYVIDATTYGNVSRFINHSCSPNLVCHQVLVDSMDSQRAHIGLYASRDIAYGEELTCNYRYKLLPGEGYPCHCGASKCRGRLY